MERNSPPTIGDRDHFLCRFLAIETNLYRYVCAVVPAPHDARDIVQETALVLWEQRERYGSAQLFLPWALGIARNKALQHLVRQGRAPRLLADESLLHLIMDEQEFTESALEDRRERLQACLEKLSTEHRTLIRGY